MIYKQLLLALAPFAAATAAAAEESSELHAATDGADATKKNLRGVVSLAADVENDNSSSSSSSSSLSATATGPFSNACLTGRFSYTNLIADVASVSVTVFDGNGGISEMDNIEINVPDPENGGRSEVSLPFNSGSYEVYANGRGFIRLSLGGPGGPYYNPPALAEFVVTGTSDDCEITAMDGFLSASSEKDVGVANQLVAPKFRKIADF